MTDKIDTSNEAVGRLVFASLTASPTHLSAMSDTLCALAVERDALRQRVEKAEAALEEIAMTTPMWEGGMGVSKVNLANTLEEARQIARAALRQDEGDDE